MKGQMKRTTFFFLILSLTVLGTAGAVAMEKINKKAAIEYINSYETVGRTMSSAPAMAGASDVSTSDETAAKEETEPDSATENGGAETKANEENAGNGTKEDGAEPDSDTENGNDTPDENLKQGFIVEDDETYYYVNGEKLMGLQEIDGVTYYFSKDNGRMLTGSCKVDGSWRYFDKNTGEMVKGFLTIGNSTYYYAKNSGKKLYGVRRLGKNVYTFDKKGKLIRTVYGSKKAICLTFDDGPSDNTSKILKSLKDNGGLATFFVVGSRLKSYSSVLKEASDMGCEIANHSYSHPSFYALSSEAITKEIKRTNRRIEKYTGKKAEVCRTPGGAIGGNINDAVGMPIILWSVDTLDWKTRNADSTYKSVMKNARDGSVVLMHDLYSQTAEAAVRMIPALKKAGYQLVTVKEMSLLKKKPLKDGEVYFRF